MSANTIIKEQEIFHSKILLLDDEDINVDLLSDVLESEGYLNISCETDPIRALELYKNEKFDILLLDINMPELDGFGVMKVISELNEAVKPPILIFTALHDQDICNRALASGATDFIHKPFDADEALNRIKNLLTAHFIKKRLINTNNHLEDLVDIRTQEVLAAKLKVVEHLGFAAEYRDTDTAAHTIRVGEYSALLARELGLNDNFVELIHYAAPLHDIGKIGIPDAILLKPARLEADEWSTMQTHASIGAEILEHDDDPLIMMARTIAMTHHEKFDGKGYPNGLLGEGIPIEGRIVMLADVYDALTMKRPYKEAWSTEKTIDFINEKSGQMFDPKLVDLFSGLTDKFFAIRKKHLD